MRCRRLCRLNFAANPILEACLHIKKGQGGATLRQEVFRRGERKKFWDAIEGISHANKKLSERNGKVGLPLRASRKKNGG